MVEAIAKGQPESRAGAGDAMPPCPPYLWRVMEIAYLCRGRGIEVVSMTDANETECGLLMSRRRGSNNDVVKVDASPARCMGRGARHPRRDPHSAATLASRFCSGRKPAMYASISQSVS